MPPEIALLLTRYRASCATDIGQEMSHFRSIKTAAVVDWSSRLESRIQLSGPVILVSIFRLDCVCHE